MARNILLTSLCPTETDLPARYFSIRKEFGFDYCDALLDAEAGIKVVLSRYDIDEIIVIGGTGSFNEGDELNSVDLGYGSNLYSKDKASLSSYALLQYQIAKYADELPPDKEEDNISLPDDVKQKLISFIREFHEGNPALKNVKFNRLFDALVQSDEIRENFWSALFKARPELCDNQNPCRRWVKSYLYAELKPSAKLELLPINEDVCIRFITEAEMQDSDQWINSMMATEKAITKEQEEINLYVSLNSDDAADTFFVMNMLDILVTMPGSKTHLKKLFTIRNTPQQMSGIIRDDTEGFGFTGLFHAIRSFLNYGKADMIVDIWKKSGEQNEYISGMVYAMRSVDVGLSMCNIPLVEHGILRLRELFKSEEFWRASGHYGMYFSIISESIREDYGALLEGNERIPFIDLVKWAYRHQFYQQTLTLIESNAPENLVSSGIFYYCDDEEKTDNVTRLFAQQRLSLKPYEYYKMDSIDHYFIKTYNRSGTRGKVGKGEDPQRVYAALRTQSVENSDSSLITGFTACDSLEALQDILFAYYHVGDVRNKISHADATAMREGRLVVAESDEHSALIWMRDSIEFFIDRYEKAMAQVQGKKPNVVIITGDDVSIAAEHMKHEKH